MKPWQITGFFHWRNYLGKLIQYDLNMRRGSIIVRIEWYPRSDRQHLTVKDGKMTVELRNRISNEDLIRWNI